MRNKIPETKVTIKLEKCLDPPAITFGRGSAPNKMNSVKNKMKIISFSVNTFNDMD